MIEKVLVANLKTLVRAYARGTGYSMVRISKQVYGGAHFLDELLAGDRSVSIRKYDEIVATLKSGWPEGTAWPMCEVLVFKGPKVTKVTALSPRTSTAA